MQLLVSSGKASMSASVFLGITVQPSTLCYTRDCQKALHFREKHGIKAAAETFDVST